MNQPKALDLTGGWESIVNNVERHNARLRFDEYLHQRKLKKKIGQVAELAMGAILSVVLGTAGLLDPWLAGVAAVIFVCLACFHGGRVYEKIYK